MEQNAKLFLLQQSYFISFLGSVKEKLQEGNSNSKCISAICYSITFLIAIESHLAQLFEKAIAQSPPLIIAKLCFDDVR